MSELHLLVAPEPPPPAFPSWSSSRPAFGSMASLLTRRRRSLLSRWRSGGFAEPPPCSWRRWELPWMLAGRWSSLADLVGDGIAFTGGWSRLAALSGRFATNVDWGGVVYSPPGVPEPPMGSSYFPIENSSYDAYCARVIIFNEKGKAIEVDKTITHIDNPNMYKVEFIQLSYGAKDMYFVLYGGPGESTHV
ncbi:hypothetical protein H5410_030183 [Solanum commersonii]|uniref:Neprosin PEP catalytic domain-containing protein n=1 Tax=Solanum commersonii TaxID=4109 RepID=A0A9J5YFE3_SOLCO|nr:hypothetical protein H5410_030183 [Solanum commersonii]